MEEVPEGCRMAYMESPLALPPPSRSSCDWLFPPSSPSPPGPAETGLSALFLHYEGMTLAQPLLLMQLERLGSLISEAKGLRVGAALMAYLAFPSPGWPTWPPPAARAPGPPPAGWSGGQVQA